MSSSSTNRSNAFCHLVSKKLGFTATFDSELDPFIITANKQTSIR